MPVPVMLFAAGFGTRMGQLTADRPKPLIPVGGAPLIDHALRIARGIAPPRVVANAHYRADQIAAHLEGSGVLISIETPDILETGGGLRAALPLLQDPTVATLNTDAVWSGPNPLALLRDAWDPARMDALLIGIAPQNALGHAGTGDFTTDPDGRARRGPGMIYGGAQIIRTDGLSEIEDRAFSLNLLWDRMLDRGRLFVLSYPGRWCDVGHPDGITLAEELLQDV